MAGHWGDTHVLEVLDQLNRDMVALRDRYRQFAEEAYPGHKGEIQMPPAEYDNRMARCDHENAIAMGVDLARKYVLAARKEAELEEVPS